MDHPLTTPMHHAVIAAIGQQLTTARPACEAARIARAVALVLDGHVALQGNDHAIVRSQSGPTAYIVKENTCGCEDAARHPHAQCKHVYARVIQAQYVWVMKLARYATDESGTWGMAWPTKAYDALWFLPDGTHRAHRVTLADLVIAGKVADSTTISQERRQA